MVRRSVWAALVLLPFAAQAQSGGPATPPAIDLAALTAAAAKRFPQPVRVGDLLGKDVLKPVESQPVLGHVAAITRRPDGGLAMIIRYGGVLGIDTRHIAVPVEAVALLGPSVAMMGFTPQQLDRFPSVGFPAPATLPPDTSIKVGIVRPFH